MNAFHRTFPLGPALPKAVSKLPEVSKKNQGVTTGPSNLYFFFPRKKFSTKNMMLSQAVEHLMGSHTEIISQLPPMEASFFELFFARR